MNSEEFSTTRFTIGFMLALLSLSTAATAGAGAQPRYTLKEEAVKAFMAADYTVLQPDVSTVFNLPAKPTTTLFVGMYTLHVPSNAVRLEINLRTATANADVDLYLRYDQDVDLASDGRPIADHRSERDRTGDEDIIVTRSSSPPLRSGTYYVALGLYTTNIAASGTIIARLQIESTPSISSLSPSTAQAGGPGFTLTVNGANFVSASVVNWNGAPLTTSYVSATKLTATVPAAKISAAGSASITVTNPGPTTSAAVSFTITPQPGGGGGGGGTQETFDFYNAIGGKRDGPAPGSLAKVVAKVLAPSIQGCVYPSDPMGPLPLLLGEVTIEFSGYWAPLLKVCNTGGEQSVTFQVPFEIEAGWWPVTIRARNTPYSIPAVKVSAVSPAIYLTRMSDGQRRALILRPNGSYVSLENPAQRGETLRAFVNGLGPLSPAIGSNTPGGGQVADLSLRYPVIVGVHNAGAPLVYARYATNLTGVYEIGFRLPEGVPSGSNVLFVVAAEVDGALVFSDGTTLPVQ